METRKTLIDEMDKQIRDLRTDLLSESLRFGCGWLALAKIVNCLFFHEGQDVVRPTTRLQLAKSLIGVTRPIPSPAASRKLFIGAVMDLERQADLLQIIFALRDARRFAGRLNGGQQESDQDANDGDDN